MHLNLLYVHSKYSGNNINMNPLFLRLVWRIFIYIAKATSWRRQVLLYAHLKCVESSSMLIQNMEGAALFYHVSAQSNTIRLHDVNRAAHAIF
jgi:hypothetical protein